MSVFAGGCELDAFAAVCLDEDSPPADEVLDELVRTSFVTVDFAAAASAVPAARAGAPVRRRAPRRRRRAGRAATSVTCSTTSISPSRCTGWETSRSSRCRSPSCNATSATTGSPSTGRRQQPEQADAGLRLAAYLYSLWTEGQAPGRGRRPHRRAARHGERLGRCSIPRCAVARSSPRTSTTPTWASPSASRPSRKRSTAPPTRCTRDEPVRSSLTSTPNAATSPPLASNWTPRCSCGPSEPKRACASSASSPRPSSTR